jgi:hypothetical protein
VTEQATRKRRLRFVTSSPPCRVLELEAVVVGRLTGGAGFEITPPQDAALRAIESANAGDLPTSQEEFQALTDGDTARLLDLAGSPDSSLHPLFCWGLSEAARLHRQRHLHGTGDWGCEGPSEGAAPPREPSP